MMMRIKSLLRKRGYDIVRHHSAYDSIISKIAPRTILDIGANTGAYAQAMRMRFPDAYIHSFEPLPECFTNLASSMQADPRFTAHNVALGSENGSSVIHRSSFNPSSSLREMAPLHKKLYPKSAGYTDEMIRVARLDDLSSSLTLEAPLMIKMDVQGFEDQVIIGGSETIKKASVLVVETSFVSLYEGQPLFADIHRLVHELGFEYRGRLESHYNRLTDELIYEDAVFARRS